MIDENLDIFRTNLDRTCRKLGVVLPSINRVIQKTYDHARQTMDSLGRSGMIDVIMHTIEEGLHQGLTYLEEAQQQDARTQALLSALQAHLASVCAPADLDAQQNPQAQSLLGSLGRLMAGLDEMHRTEGELLHAMQAYRQTGVPSLVASLESITEIFMDLINRSAATKAPIARIMTRLQLHDIVGQDLETIFQGLAAIARILQEEVLPLEEGDTCSFQAEILHRSDSLLKTVVSVTEAEHEEIEQEMGTIQMILARVKEDKDHLSEFLLYAPGHMSTFSLIIRDTCGSLEDIPERLSHLGEASASTSGLLRALQDNLRQTVASSSAGMTAGPGFPLQDFLGRLEMLAGLYTSREHSTGELYHKAVFIRDHALHHLQEMQSHLLQAARGIDAYTDRCMSLVDQFLHELRGISLVLETCTEISVELKRYAIDLGGETATERGALEAPPPVPEFDELLYRLAHPHIASMIQHGTPSDPEDRLTLF